MKKLKYLLAGVLVSAVAGCFVACDDDEYATDEWTADYVYLERLKLGIGSLEFNQTHSSLGIAGDTEVSMPFAVCLAKPWKSDVAVKFAYTIEGDMPEEIVTFREGGAVVIPAGELVARDTMDLRTDWSMVQYSPSRCKNRHGCYKDCYRIGDVQCLRCGLCDEFLCCLYQR